MGRPAHARASFIASEGWAQDRPEPPTQSPVKYPRVNSQSSVKSCHAAAAAKKGGLGQDTVGTEGRETFLKDVQWELKTDCNWRNSFVCRRLGLLLTSAGPAGDWR